MLLLERERERAIITRDHMRDKEGENMGMSRRGWSTPDASCCNFFKLEPKNKIQETQKPHQQQQLQNLHYSWEVGCFAGLPACAPTNSAAQRSGASQQRATEKLLSVRSACARELARRGRGNGDSRLAASRWSRYRMYFLTVICLLLKKNNILKKFLKQIL
jgi:hypothetical protein